VFYKFLSANNLLWKTTFFYWKKVICSIMVAMMIVANIFQPVLAIGNFFDQFGAQAFLQTEKESTTSSRPPVNTNQQQMVPPSLTTSVEPTYNANPLWCIVSVEVCNQLDDDCDWLVDEWLICNPPDACTNQWWDSDNDDVCNNQDNCDYSSNPNQADSDNDGIGNVCDNCPTTYNPTQLDTDQDGIGDACEPIVDECPNPVTATLTSHTNNQTVNAQTVTLTWTAQWAVGSVVVIVWTTSYTATVVNGVWSATVQLAQWTNNIWVKAMHSNGNQTCTYTLDIVLNYQPSVTCPNPVTATLTSHTNNQTVNAQTVTLTWTAQWAVGSVVVIVWTTSYTATVVNGVWSATVQLAQWTNNIWVKAMHSNGNQTCTYTLDIVLNYQPSVTCPNPVTATLTSHTNNQTVNAQTVTLTWTAQWAVGSVVVIVWTTSYTATVVNGVWSATVQLAQWTNNIWVKAMHSNGNQTCTYTLDIVLNYQPSVTCPNPVTVTLTSHTNNQTVNAQTVTLTWTAQWAVGSVVVIVWTTSYTATVVNGVWSATVQLQTGSNNIWVKGMHSNGNQTCTYTLDIVLNYQPSVTCPNPVTATLTSHTNNQTVNAQTVTLTWTAQWAVGSVVVIVWTTSYTATVVNGVWSATVQLAQWTNNIWVKAMHSNGNQTCTYTLDIVLNYQPSVTCPNPVTVTLTSHTNNQTVNAQTVTLTWTAQWAVGSVVVIVWTTSYTATVVNGVWSATVQLAQWTNNIWVKAMHSNGNQTCTYTLDIVLNYQPSVTCPNPVTVTLTSHTNNQTVNAQTVTLTWTAQWAVGSVVVIVWTTSYTATVVNGVWSATVQLQTGANNIWVKAMHTNGNQSCSFILDIVLNYNPVVDICPNPISNIVVTSHTYDQVIQQSVVPVLSGTVQWNVARVEVVVWGNTYVDTTIVNGVWSVDNVLLPVIGQNPITINVYHANQNSFCTVSKYFQLIRTNNSIITTCTETAVTPATVQLNNWFFTITCQWTNVSSYSVQVTLPNSTITNLLTWSTNSWNQFTYLPTTTWTYTFVCHAKWLNDAICPSTVAVVTQGWGWSCELPVNYIKIDTPTSWTVTSAWSIEVKGTVLPVGNVKKVIVGWVEATISGSVFTALVSLQSWTNLLLATAYSKDDDCGTITDTTTIIRQWTWGVCDYPIALQVTQPSSNTSTSSSSIRIKWNVLWSGVVLNVWSTVVTPSLSGDFTYNYPLVRGTQTITITAANSDIDCTQTVQLSVNRTWGWGGGWRPSSITCGNNRLDSGEQCDDGNYRNGDGCSSSCQIERIVCGNNKIEKGETCDDGNTKRGDGCNSICQLEDDIIKKVKMRPVPFTFTPPTALPTILPKTGIALRQAPTRQLVN
jgi:cysteine-rich repeat protein